MEINGVEFNASLEQILNELVSQMRLNNIDYMQKMKPAGNSIQVCCPYHAQGLERRPSAGIRKSDGKFHCFACGEIHELNEVISYCFGYDSEHDAAGAYGWKWLLKNFATVAVEERQPIKLNLSRQQVKAAKKIEYVSEEELDKYRYYHPYWRKRGITDEAIIELFDLGYDRDSDCITFPVRDVSGRTLFVAKRSTKTKYFHYPKDVEKPLYGLYEYHKVCTTGIVGGRCNGKTEFLRRLNEIIVCESMLDALSFWTVGKYAVALNGLGSELQLDQLRQLPCRKLILATDNDKAGMKARERIRKNIKNKIITEYIFPDGRKDANDCSPEELRNLEEIF